MGFVHSSYGRCKGRCLIRVLSLVCGVCGPLHANFRIKCLFCNVDMHFDCAGSHKVWAASLVYGILPVNVRIKWLFCNVDMHFDSAGLSRSGLVILVCTILPVNFRMKWLFCNVDMHFDCAGSHKVCVCVCLRSGLILVCGL